MSVYSWVAGRQGNNGMKDILSKRERLERTLNLKSVDRVAIHDQVSYNPGVVSLYTGRKMAVSASRQKGVLKEMNFRDLYKTLEPFSKGDA